ncbi:MAG: hypothetical protein JXD22_13695 [Sedimentisphaerales bacterium]|nr:hypothetical protein [Sedimentisphaerales bacterium]
MPETCNSKRSIFLGTNFVLALAWIVCGSIQTPCHAEKPPIKKVSFPPAQNLPSFGVIDWKAEKIPFVPDRPGAGISGAAIVILKGKIYIAGGFIPAGDETDDKQSRCTSRWTFCYDPQTKKWTKLPNMPGRREYTRGIATDDAFYVIGGAIQRRDTEEKYGVRPDCFMLTADGKELSWKLHSKLSVPRSHTGVGWADNCLIVAGGNEYNIKERGYSKNTIRNTTEVFDLGQPEKGWQVRTPIPGLPRGWVGSVVHDDHLYLFGGTTWQPERRGVAEVLRYDVKKDKWRKLAAAPFKASGWEGALYRDRYVMLIGGIIYPEHVEATTKTFLWNDMPFVYDIKDDCWLKIDSPLPPGGIFNDPGVCIIDDTIYVLGAEGPGGTHFNHFLIGTIKPKIPLATHNVSEQITLNGNRELFIDDYLISSRSNLTRTLHQPVKDPRNPVLTPKGPWETNPYLFGTVIYDKDLSLYRMWYMSYNSAKKVVDCTPVLYATSSDGVCWDKPNLGLFSFDGSTDNNIILVCNGYHDLYCPSVILDANAADPDRLYKMIYWDFTDGPNTYGDGGMCLAFSPDGIH